MSIIYAGEMQCEFEGRSGRCKAKATYRIGGKMYYCGTHSKKNPVMRRELPQHPHPNELSDARVGKMVQIANTVASARKEKLSADGLARTCVQCACISMKVRCVTGSRERETERDFFSQKEREFTPPEGWICIFPNNYHGHGFGWGFGDFSGLSPMQLGPVSYQLQPRLPVPTCIENRHQFEKVEILDMLTEGPLCTCDRSLEWPHYAPSDAFYALRDEGFANPKPVRHKHPRAKIMSSRKQFLKEHPGFAWRYTVHRDVSGRDCHYTYIESRYFYCKDMEMLALKSPAFQRLVELRQQGYQMLLCGYDGYPFTDGIITPQTAYDAFCDELTPFGHERVLAVLLTAHDNPDWHLPNDYPWYRYFSNHLDVYSWERRQMKFERLKTAESAQKKAKTDDDE
jgi:hypothetical protein